ncbi:HIT domain-containing protein [Candidatus Parcubacteria bacterium]|nr:HIT domain-containing protein [Candidatus Parcubacteria bacterium]
MYVNPDNTKDRPDDVYKNVINDIQKDSVCPFCPDQLAKYHKNPVLLETNAWLATENMYPYNGAKHHILFIHKKHISNLDEIQKKTWTEFHELLQKIIKSRSIPGGTFFIRFGETRYNGASVTHLHAHLVSSDPDNKDYRPLLTRIG